MKRIKPSRTNCISRILFRVRVSGESCWPVLVPGKSYWASTLMRIRKGDFIVFRNPVDPEQIFVKKILGMQDEMYEVVSTVSWGLSGADFGMIHKEQVLGRVIWNTM